jgi:hypothetical protein
MLARRALLQTALKPQQQACSIQERGYFVKWSLNIEQNLDCFPGIARFRTGFGRFRRRGSAVETLANTPYQI